VSNNYTNILLEDIQSKFDAIIEGQVAMAYVPAKLESIDNRLTSIESDVKIIKLSVSDHENILKNQEVRIAELGIAD